MSRKLIKREPIQVYRTGSRPLVLNLENIDADTAFILLKEMDHVFRLHLVTWERESGTAQITLVPDNGMVDVLHIETKSKWHKLRVAIRWRLRKIRNAWRFR